MIIQACPFCKEQLHPEATTCHHCRRELNTSSPSRRNRPMWLAIIGMTALLVGGTAVLTCEFLRERKKWLR